jgi:uncharacterized protein YbjT (DUF2867 family)
VLGRALAEKLRRDDRMLWVMSRSPEHHRQLAETGANLVYGDLTKPETLTKACRGKHAVIAAAHSMLGRGRYASERVDGQGMTDLIDAAKREGVQHLVFLSVIGAGPDHPIDFWRTKWKTEQYMASSGIPHTVIRCAAFMEWHVREFIGKPILTSGKVFIPGKGESRINFVSVRDVAGLIDRSLDDPNLHNRIIDIAGPDHATRNAIARMYAEHANRPVAIRHIPRPMLDVLKTVLRPFHPGISRVLAISAWTDREDQLAASDSVITTLHLPMTRLTDFIRSG